MFLIGLPICYYAARYGVDIDLLTRGAGFGYMGSTITSLIYASFTFLLFAIEASIMSMALQMLFDIPLAIAHLISSLIVIPIAIYGISLISQMQLVTQPMWLVLQFLPIAYIAWKNPAEVGALDRLHRQARRSRRHRSICCCLAWPRPCCCRCCRRSASRSTTCVSFRTATGAIGSGWWTAVIATGPGWVVMGGFKILAGSFLAFLALASRRAADQADEPTEMYFLAFRETVQSPTVALVLTGIFVIVCQLKINVTNAYAGSIAWSNFFSRLTHSHPGRVVWLVFNVLLALLLMETGIFQAIESILVIYANFAAGWIGALTADLVINKPLGFSPAVHRVQARAPVRHQSGRRRRAAAVDRRLEPRVSRRVRRRCRRSLSPFVALLRRLRGSAAHRMGDEGTLLPRARARADCPKATTEIRCTICENVFDGATWRCVRPTPARSARCAARSRRVAATCARPTAASPSNCTSFCAYLPPPMRCTLNTRAGHFFGSAAGVQRRRSGCCLSFIYHQYGGDGGGARGDRHDAVGGLLSCSCCRASRRGSSCWRTKAGALPRPNRRGKRRCSWRKSRPTNAPTRRCRRQRKSPKPPTSPRRATSSASATRFARRSIPSSAMRNCSNAASAVRPTTPCA